MSTVGEPRPGQELVPWLPYAEVEIHDWWCAPHSPCMACVRELEYRIAAALYWHQPCHQLGRSFPCRYYPGEPNWEGFGHHVGQPWCVCCHERYPCGTAQALGVFLSPVGGTLYE